MRFLPYLLKHLRRNWFRTALTVGAMALCIFLFCTLQTVLAEINGLLEGASAKRLVTLHSVSLVFNLPLSYGARIQSVPGVTRVAAVSWFGGSLPAKKEEKKAEDEDSSTTDFPNFFPNLAVEPEPFLSMYPEYMLPPDQYQAYLQDLRGCIIGRKLADRFGWKLGDTFFLESFIPPYRKRSGPIEFVVQAIFDADLNKHPGTDTNVAFFHYKYLYEGVGQNISAGTYNVEIEDPSQAAAISKAIDALFENSDSQTLTETEKAFRAGFISMADTPTRSVKEILTPRRCRSIRPIRFQAVRVFDLELAGPFSFDAKREEMPTVPSGFLPAFIMGLFTPCINNVYTCNLFILCLDKV